uniref:Putative O-antigen polymerase n=1 Tax=mine drainage metagenome TaxID=410659 RepID=E6PN58_9ZZZZ
MTQQALAQPTLATSNWRLVDLAAVLMAFTLPLPTALGSVATVLLLLAWLLSGRWGEQFQRWRAVPTAMWATALLLMFVIGTTYSAGTGHGVSNFMGKYAKLLLVPVLIMALMDPRWRRRAINAFLLGAVIATALSYARFFNWVPTRLHESVVQGHIHFGTIMAFAAYFFARKAFEPGRWRWLWVLVAAWMAFDLLYINIARTGYVVVFALIVLLAWQRFRLRGLVIGTVAAVVLAGVAFTAFPVAKLRLEQAVSNIQQYKQFERTREGNLDANSLGLRLQFWSNSLRLIAQHPILGTGTGSLHEEYAKLVAGTNTLDAVNPHNEYLSTTVQLGVIGLALLLGMGIAAWRDGLKLPVIERDALQGVIVTIAVGSLFNSLLLDVNEGRFFVVMLGLLLAAVAHQVRKQAEGIAV